MKKKIIGIFLAILAVVLGMVPNPLIRYIAQIAETIL